MYSMMKQSKSAVSEDQRKKIEEEIEKEMQDKTSQLADWTFNNFKPLVEQLEKSPLSKASDITEWEVAALGQQFKNYMYYERMLETQGSVGALGQIPKMAFDIITAQFATSVLPLMASVQPIDGRRGIVWFRQIRALDDRGDVSAQDVLSDPRQNLETPVGYAKNRLEDVEVVAATVDAQLSYTFTLPGGLPILPQYLTITTDVDSSFKAKDFEYKDGTKNVGILYGKGMDGEVNYNTGEVTINFSDNPGAGQKLFASFQQDLERGDDLQEVSSFMDSTDIEADIYALKSSVGMLQNFTMNKTFGMSAFQQIANDLVTEVNKEKAGDAVRKLRSIASTQGAAGTAFNINPGSGESFAEHTLQWFDELGKRNEVLQSLAGRGKISTLVLGRRHASYVRNLPGFEELYSGHEQGIHLAGRVKGINIISVPETKLLGRLEGIALYKGLSSSFEAPIVYSPYMPMVLTDLLPEGKNPLNQMRGAASMAGVKEVVRNYAVRFDIAE